MHIFTRRSSTASISHAEAWHTTSRSRGCTNWERSQALRQRGESKTSKEVFAVVDHGATSCKRSGVALVGGEVFAFPKRPRRRRILLRNLLLQRGFQIQRLELRQLRIGGRDQVVNIAPLLRPHIAQQ